MTYKAKKKHLVALLSAMTIAGASTVIAVPFGDDLQDNVQGSTTYISSQGGNQIRFGEVSTAAGGGVTVANSSINPTLSGGGANLDYVYTSLNSITPERTANLQGGIVIDPNTGNTTIAQAGTQTESLSADLIRVRRLEVYNQNEADQTLWGQAVNPAGDELYGYVDANGDFQEVTLSAAAVTALDTFVATPDAASAEGVFAALTPADLTALGDLYSPGTLASDPTTGNLVVEGTTTTGVLEAESLTVGGVAAATADDIAAEATARADADVVLQDNIDAEATARADADVVLQDNIDIVDGKIDTEIATRESLIRQEADGSIHIGANSLVTNEVGGVQELYAQDAGSNPIDINVTNGSNLQVNGVNVATADDITAEAATRAAADTQLQANIDAEATARANADILLGQRIDTIDTRVITESSRIDGLETRTSALEGRVSNVERNIRSLRKGIAMAAALQTPVIEPGDKQAVKFGVASYDGEQGLGFGYALRLNDSVTVNVDVATGFPETVARGGLNLSF